MFQRAFRFFRFDRMLKSLLKWSLILSALAGAGYAIYVPVAKSIAERNKPRWRTAKVESGAITATVNATGTIKPVKSVQVGSFVSGPIQELHAEFNQEVKQNELLARIDPRLFAADVARAQASLATQLADVQRVEALLQQAVNDERRAANLKERNVDYISLAELDQVKFNRMSLEAQLGIAKASVAQAEASLNNAKANLDYTEIRSPEDGMIIDRKVEPGQTLAAQFQTPELFVVGVGMREKMHVFADVDESEIGLIRQAAAQKLPVAFTVDAYPDELFHGLIEEVRFSSTTTQNVVTYPVVVAAQNPELKLLPGMTANLSFQVAQVDRAKKIPKAALRFYPPDSKHVHPDSKAVFEGSEKPATSQSEDEQEALGDAPAAERVASNAKNRRRHVWVLDGEKLRAIDVQVGVSDHQFSQLTSGSIEPGTELVTGLKAKGEE
jgi:HlyD family secretion protein